MRDTSVEAERRYYELLAKRSPADRLGIAGRLTRSVRALAEMAIKAAEPTASKDEVRARLAERLYGAEVATRFFPTHAWATHPLPRRKMASSM